jgi:predicted nucleic acid-binding protein
VKVGVLVLDASAVINLLGCGAPERILAALECRCVVEENTRKEVVRNPFNSEPAEPHVEKLVAAGLLTIGRMSDASYEDYVELVSGDPREALGRGESAAIAYAAEVGGVIVLDDLKARRIANAKFRERPLLTSVALFRKAGPPKGIPMKELSELVILARQNARMHVLQQDRDWVDSLSR